MYRIPVRQLARSLRHSLRPLTHNQAQPSRGFGSRWLVPRWRPFPWHEEAMDMSRMMERQMRNMERMMEDVTSTRGWLEFAPRTRLSRGIKVTHNENKYEVSVDVKSFANSGDIELKTANDRLIITAKDTASTDEVGSLYTQMHREIHIPQDVLQETLSASMTEDGHLVISGRVKPREKIEEKVIEIKHDKTEKK